MDKNQNKASPKHEENRRTLSFGRQNLAESDKGSWFNQLSEREATSASSLNVSAVSKKKIMGNRRKQCYERATSKNDSGLFFVVWFLIVRNEYKRMPPCIFETTLRHSVLLGLVLFCGSTFFSFRFVLC